MQCPRRSESHFGTSADLASENDYDKSDDSCSYCGSLNPDTFMSRLESGDVRLGATDKNYKVYVENDGGAPFKQTYRNCPHDKEIGGAARNKYMTWSCEGPSTCTHWVTRETSSTKFYFQHLSEDQKNRFIELFNDKKIKFQGGIGFYVLPYFTRRETVGSPA